MNSNEQSKTPKRWLSPKDLFNEYGFGLDSQAKMRMTRKIPYSKIGKKILYCRLSIDSWIESNRVDTIA